MFLLFLHNLLNVLVQIANKMGLQKKNDHQDHQRFITADGHVFTSWGESLGVPANFFDVYIVR
jgi:hypothetical protein